MTPPKFSKKEIKKESIGEKLRKAREKKNLTLEDIEEVTKIRVRFLSALEREDWENLPETPYTLGFLKSYCQALDLKSEPILSQFKKERGVENQLFSKMVARKKVIKEPKIYITPSLLFVSLVGFVVLGIFSYIGYQILGFARPPSLLIQSPNSGSLVSENPVTLLGKTDKYASLYVNEQLLALDEKGNFKEEVKLKEGVNKILISAKNRTGKKTEKELVIIYQPK